ncbi:MAG: WD40 repeat domain-containing protein [Pseudomonadota bacterium]
MMLCALLAACGGGGGGGYGGGGGSAPPAGTLDSTFGSGGKVVTAIGSGSNANDLGEAVALAPDGKIVVAGSSYTGATWDFSLVRYNADGTLDTTFGSGGKVTTAIGAGEDRANALVLAPDGKIVVAGYSYNGTKYDFALVRYNTDGTLDPTFGSGGKVVTAIGTSHDYALALALAPDGKIVVAGYSDNGADADFALARYNANGSLDTGFGSGGKVTTPILSGVDIAFALALAPNGKIVAAGESANGTTRNSALALYNADGTLDTSFGTGGRVVTPFGSGYDAAFAIALAPDGRIVVAGFSDNGVTGRDFALTRYNANGSLDTSFGSGGKVVTAIGAGNDYARALALAPDGKIVVAGQSANGTTDDFALARYNADGSLDTTFGTGGKVVTAIGAGNDFAYALALAPDGKIVVAGSSHNGANYDFALARYHY